MAVLPDCPHIRAEILINGRPVQEYHPPEDGDDGDSPMSVTKYIEAISGANFEVRMSIDQAYKSIYAMKASICVDTLSLLGGLWTIEDLRHDVRDIRGSKSFCEDGVWQKQKLRFRSLEIDMLNNH
jgi:hypothetical protein